MSLGSRCRIRSGRGLWLISCRSLGLSSGLNLCRGRFGCGGQGADHCQFTNRRTDFRRHRLGILLRLPNLDFRLLFFRGNVQQTDHSHHRASSLPGCLDQQTIVLAVNSNTETRHTFRRILGLLKRLAICRLYRSIHHPERRQARRPFVEQLTVRQKCRIQATCQLQRRSVFRDKRGAGERLRSRILERHMVDRKCCRLGWLR